MTTNNLCILFFIKIILLSSTKAVFPNEHIGLSELELKYTPKKYLNELKDISSQELRLLINKAKNKDPFYECVLGFFYEFGINVPQSYIKSTLWFEKASKRGNPEAQFRLGVSYECGTVERTQFKECINCLCPILMSSSKYKMINLYTRAAKKGHILAQFSLGNIYLGLVEAKYIAIGKFPDINIEKARFWLEKALNNGCVEAGENLEILKREPLVNTLGLKPI